MLLRYVCLYFLFLFDYTMIFTTAVVSCSHPQFR
jgi:hypothetical protein